jgi:hypothetical protein
MGKVQLTPDYKCPVNGWYHWGRDLVKIPPAFTPRDGILNKTPCLEHMA